MKGDRKIFKLTLNRSALAAARLKRLIIPDVASGRPIILFDGMLRGRPPESRLIFARLLRDFYLIAAQ
jgi:hypothetical protein